MSVAARAVHGLEGHGAGYDRLDGFDDLRGDELQSVSLQFQDLGCSLKVFRTSDFAQVAAIPVGKLPHGVWQVASRRDEAIAKLPEPQRGHIRPLVP